MKSKGPYSLIFSAVSVERQHLHALFPLRFVSAGVDTSGDHKSLPARKAARLAGCRSNWHWNIPIFMEYESEIRAKFFGRFAIAHNVPSWGSIFRPLRRQRSPSDCLFRNFQNYGYFVILYVPTFASRDHSVGRLWTLVQNCYFFAVFKAGQYLIQLLL